METVIQRRTRYIKTAILIIVAFGMAYILGYTVARGYNVFLEQEIIYPPRKIGPVNYTEDVYGTVVYVHITGVCYEKSGVGNSTKYISLGMCREWVRAGELSRHYYGSSIEYPLGDRVIVAVYSTFTADVVITYIAPAIFVALAYGIISVMGYRFVPALSVTQLIGGFLGAKMGLEGILEKIYPYIIVKTHILLLEALFLPIAVLAVHACLKKIAMSWSKRKREQ
ncbi:hypothetical protein J4526_00865 [Desulfurococcaceae archaeon MEX13E-LK6-19]|nr:hypothetical protein J4526_00865 [Desulfurococcaceae archaeon MEX13E-LK6-19]